MHWRRTEYCKKSAWLFSFLSSQVHTLWQHHDIKLINEDSGCSRDCIYTCINIITLHLPKLFTNTTTHCGVFKECTKIYGHLNKNNVKLQGGEFRRRIQRGKWCWIPCPFYPYASFNVRKLFSTKIMLRSISYHHRNCILSFICI